MIYFLINNIQLLSFLSRAYFFSILGQTNCQRPNDVLFLEYISKLERVSQAFSTIKRFIQLTFCLNSFSIVILEQMCGNYLTHKLWYHSTGYSKSRNNLSQYFRLSVEECAVGSELVSKKKNNFKWVCVVPLICISLKDFNVVKPYCVCNFHHQTLGMLNLNNQFKIWIEKRKMLDWN